MLEKLSQIRWIYPRYFCQKFGNYIAEKKYSLFFYFRLIAFLEAKRKKAEEEGLEPVPELSEEQMREMTDEQLAAHLAAANASRDGSVCQSEESNPTSSSAAPQNSAPISGTATSEVTTSEPNCSDTKKDDPTTDGPKDSVTQQTSSC